jgi:lysine 2,3-aminomutase
MEAPVTLPAAQPYEYRRRELVEPDWTRFPGWRGVSRDQWESAQWQRANCVKNVKQLRGVLGDLVDDGFYADLVEDQERFATMSMLVPPQMLNTMATGAVTTEAFRDDPVRRYMIPIASDRRTDWTTHPHATRDSLHEHDMWVAEGLTHRYPTKVLAELLSTCPQYCGHCTRMDLVGNSTPQVEKLKLSLKPVDRYDAHMAYLRAHPGVRDVVVSGGDVANVPWRNLESYLMRLLEIETIRDIRLATKALAALPQHWLAPDVVEGLERVGRTAARRGVNLAIHTHVNHAQSVTPLVARAAKTALDVGIRDVRNQGVLMRGVNATTADLLDLCFALQGEANILPYYFYMCDMIPNAEHWRVAVWQAQELQHDIMGYLPGYATPRIVCDVPFVGKRWVHMLTASRTGRRTTVRPLRTVRRIWWAGATPTTTRSTRCPSRARSGGASR